ncbi:MAG: bifunctional oligoribonuclease/PAP phosphatase NrnA [Armatimonadetes bacterium]|nr:bifunctional oligoribonuclease/PAP phosphatase NrnA [Armatimonadota bacterium]
MQNLDQLAAAFRQMVEDSDSILIGTHLNPDGDALGSALALSLVLDQLGKPHEVVCNNLAPYNLEFLPCVDRVKLEPERTHDLGIVVDLDALHRLGRTQTFFESCQRLAVIDHHIPHEQPGDLRIVDTTASATCLILYRLFVALGVEITPDVATLLLTGIVTDTGSFKYQNTTPDALHAAAQLLECHADLGRLSEEVYQRKPLASMRLLGRCLDRLRLDVKDQLAWSLLTAEDFSRTGGSETHTEGIVNELLSINTVKIAALIRQPSADKVIRASLRSREGYDVAEVSRLFGGGGHRNAAGCTFESGSIEEAEEQLVKALRTCLESS